MGDLFGNWVVGPQKSKGVKFPQVPCEQVHSDSETGAKAKICDVEHAEHTPLPRGNPAMFVL